MTGQPPAAWSEPAQEQLGQRIRAERLRQRISLRSLATSVGVSASLVSQIETGKCRPSVSTLYAITTALGVTIDDVFGPPGDEGDQAGDAAYQAGDAAYQAGDEDDQVSGEGHQPGRSGRAGELPRAGGTRPAPVSRAMATSAAALAALAADHDRRLGPIVGPEQREVLELDSGVTWERLGHVPGQPGAFVLATYAPGGSSSSTGQLMRHTGTEYGFLISGELIVTLGFSEYPLAAGDAICFESSTPHRYRNESEHPAAGVWFVADADADVR